MIMIFNNGLIIEWFQGKPIRTLDITYAITLSQLIGIAINWEEPASEWDCPPNIIGKTSTGIKLRIDPGGNIQATWYYLIVFGY